MPRSKPINADVPAVQAPPAEAKPAEAGQVEAKPRKAEKTGAAAAPPPSSLPRRRRPVPAALKAVAGLVVVAIVFLAAAIVGGGGNDGSAIPGAAPSEPSRQEQQTTTAAAPVEEAPEELGYPEFATNNTTRVGSADPESNAAAVALAVYPSVEASQRPDAVTVVDAADWKTAIAAAALMAEPIAAPLLISAAGEVPQPTAAALSALQPEGSPATKGTQVFAIGAAAVPAGYRTRTVRATGLSGAAAIAALREQLAGGPPSHIVIASEDPAFAMPAAAWAARSGDPVLYSPKQGLPPETAAALKRTPNVPVYVLGPSSTISSEVVRQIARIDRNVRRVSGEDPVSNSVALARYRGGDFGWDVNDPGHGFVVVPSDSPLDAAAAAPLSASGTWGPLLVSDSADTLPAALREYLLDVKPGYTTNPTRAFYNHVWVIGDADAISVGEQAEIDEIAELARIGGEE